MKSAAKTPGKLLAGLCLILFFCLMPVRSYAAEQQLSEITKLYVTGNLWQRNTAAAESQLAVCR